jgi:integration host factor subunit beta
MTKSDLIQRMADKLKLPTARSESIVNTVFGAMTDALVRGERIEIRGFGTFEVRSYKGYEGRNPKTGNPVQVAPKKLPFFKIGKELHERLNRSAAAAAPLNPPPTSTPPSTPNAS